MEVIIKTYLSIHSSGEGELGVTICLTNSEGVVSQGVLNTDFVFDGKSAVLRSKVPFSEFDEFEVNDTQVGIIRAHCGSEWSKYSIVNGENIE